MNLVILLLYVDDLFVTGEDGLITDTKRNLDIEFELKDFYLIWALPKVKQIPTFTTRLKTTTQ